MGDINGASVLTIAAGRADHLRNVMLGLARQTLLPLELVIAYMQEAPYQDLPEVPFPVRQIAVHGSQLPLAKARNAAAKAAVGDALIFLDVDCIPAEGLVADYTAALAHFDGVAMGEVMYLPGGVATADRHTDNFAALAVKHSDRQGPPTDGIETCSDYRCFWSLNFALRADVYAASSGFDERYCGYGGEDTDFAKSLSVAGVPMGWLKGARVYHQYHPHHMPPVHHLHSVVRNAELFAQKWGYRTMEHWLYAFMLMGLIDNSGPRIEILREPGPEHIAFTQQQSHQPYANTATVIRALKAQIAAEEASTQRAVARVFQDGGQKDLLYPGAVQAAE